MGIFTRARMAAYTDVTTTAGRRIRATAGTKSKFLTIARRSSSRREGKPPNDETGCRSSVVKAQDSAATERRNAAPTATVHSTAATRRPVRTAVSPPTGGPGGATTVVAIAVAMTRVGAANWTEVVTRGRAATILTTGEPRDPVASIARAWAGDGGAGVKRRDFLRVRHPKLGGRVPELAQNVIRQRNKDAEALIRCEFFVHEKVECFCLQTANLVNDAL